MINLPVRSRFGKGGEERLIEYSVLINCESMKKALFSNKSKIVNRCSLFDIQKKQVKRTKIYLTVWLNWKCVIP